MRSSLAPYVLVLLLCARLFAFDHTYTQYQSVLDKYVRDGKVNYAALKTDRTALDSFVVACGEVSFDRYQAFTKSEQISFVINLYNAATMQLLIDHWPVGSIQEIGGFLTGPWNKQFVMLFGHTVSLGQIEHDVLRASFKDYRLHFAIVCGSEGAPELPNTAYTDRNLNTQLAAVERSYLTERPAENRMENGELFVSSLFKWYRDDFNGDDGIRTLFQTYYPEVTKTTRINFTDYQWSVNSFDDEPEPIIRSGQ